MTKLMKRLDKFEWFILVVVLGVHAYVATHSGATVLDWFHTDDAFYYFVPARNIAQGLGVTFDGITTTNGFHPLWLLVNVPVFALFKADPIQPLRVVVMLLATLHAGSAVLLYRLLKRSVGTPAAQIAALFWAFSPSIHSLTAKGGIESGLNAFFLLLFWYYLVALKQGGKDTKQYLFVGITALFTIFSRLDNIFIVFWGGIWLFFDELRLLFSPSRWAATLKNAAAFGLPGAVGLGIYLLWNKLAVGTFMPLSGSIKSWWGYLPFTVYGTAEFKHGPLFALVNHTFSTDINWGPWSLVMGPMQTLGSWLGPLVPTKSLYSGIEPRVYAAFGLVILLCLAIVWGAKRVSFPAAVQLGLLPFFLAALTHSGYYNLRGSLAQRYWYWVLENILLVLVGSVLLAALFELLRRLIRSEDRYGRVLPLFAILAGAGMLWLHGQYIQSSLRAPGSDEGHFYLRRTAWIENHTPEGARIAITGAGALSYFTEGRTIVNMDGLMNGAEYFQLLQAGEGADYLEDIGVDYVFGSQAVVKGSSPYAQMLKDKLVEDDMFVDGEREIILWEFAP